MLWKEMEIKAMSEGINVLHNIWQSIVKKLYLFVDKSETRAFQARVATRIT